MLDFVGDDEFGYTFQTLTEILNSYDVEKIDFIMPTHHHDDHTAGISLLKQHYNTEVHALEEMVDILENPTQYRLNCLIDRQIKVDKILKDGEIFEWDDYKFQIFHFPGQTEYHMGLFGAIDGKKIFFTGDTITERSLVDRDTNVNCLNFCRLGDDVGYMKCADILLNCNPEYLGISHYGIIKVDKDLLQKFKLFVSEYEPVIADLVAQENPNIGFDPNWISFKPVRIITQPGEKVEVKLRARNYLNRISEIHYKLNLPNSWKAEPKEGTVSIEPKTFNEIPINIYVPSTEDEKSRTILTADIIWNNIRLGPFPDLMVDHGYIPSDTWTGWSHEKGGNLFIWIFNQIRTSKKFFK